MNINQLQNWHLEQAQICKQQAEQAEFHLSAVKAITNFMNSIYCVREEND